MRQILLITIGLSTALLADFTKSGDVVTDNTTGLQWQDNETVSKTWTGTIDYCEALKLDGTGWRMPNKKELLSLVDYTAYNPSIDAVFSHTTSNYYWSSTTLASNTSNAWIVRFNNGARATAISPIPIMYVVCAKTINLNEV